MKSFVVRTVISVGFLCLLFYLMRGNIPDILTALKGIDQTRLLLAVFISLTAVLIIARRLKLIFVADNIPMRFVESVNLTFIGCFFNNFLPTSVGGDIVKAMCAARITGHPVKSVTSVLMDRLFGLFTFIAIPSVSFVFFLKGSENPVVPVLIYSFLAAALFSFFLLFNRNVARRFRFVEGLLNRFHLGEKIRKVYDGLHNFKNHKAVIAQAMLLSVVGQVVSVWALYLMARALGATAPMVYFFLLVPVVHLISMLPSLNGLGIREGAYVYFLAPHIGAHNAAALGVLFLALLFLQSIIGGVIYALSPRYHVSFKRSRYEKNTRHPWTEPESARKA
ncbi:MAG: hypothetical protein A3C47_01315 [Omnitrophica bacterium RIFCSPHIGHO2_02_FULL_51_18]|nr:MAG: hypothetical protein A3C47_01315 [Omnitrophica bacterium RIFCSPHIGHO2_02_FULL_51_18]